MTNLSRVGKQPILIPEGVDIKIDEKKINISSSKGELNMVFKPEIKIVVKDNKVFVERKKETKMAKSLHGLYRTLIQNMIIGVTEGFSKTLELHGTGYRVNLEGKNLKLLLGFSHPVEVKPPEGIEFQVTDNKIITVIGFDKQLVGQTAANIRKIRAPEPYKGKGIRYQDEVVKLKPGKAAKVGTGASAT